MIPDLASPDTFADGVPHEAIAELRRSHPVVWNEVASNGLDDEPGFWAVLTHAGVVRVATQPRLFSASAGGVVLENLTPEQLAMMRNMLLAMDPPRHLEHRRPLVQSFKPRAIAAMEPGIRAICRSIMERAAEHGEVEFVQDVTAHLPSQVIGELMGLPREDWAYIHHLAEMNTSGQDPEIAGSADAPEPGTGSRDMAAYAFRFAIERRAAPPRDDLTSLILQSDFGGSPMSDVEFASFFVQLVTAGNDTTKTMLAAGLLTLLRHPDQLAELYGDRSLIATAVEEILRFDNPLHYFRRTAVEDTELHGVPIGAGDKVVMHYTAANRDEQVFDDPQRFDIRRDPNPHLSFGFGEHHCLGIHLARLEARVFFEELLATFARIELTGEPVRVRSNLSNALKRLPVSLRR